MTAVERILSTNSAGDEMVPFLCSWAMLLKSDPTATFFRTEPDFVEMCGFNVYFLHTWAFKSSNFLSTCLYLIKAAVIFFETSTVFVFFLHVQRKGENAPNSSEKYVITLLQYVKHTEVAEIGPI